MRQVCYILAGKGGDGMEEEVVGWGGGGVVEVAFDPVM